ncbi:MAG: glucokinase [Thermomonas sp.]|nr:MAG: glucokinase [Thermomonas sp.]
MAEAVTGSQQDVAGARLIAADVGGTYARIGLVEVSDTGSQLLLHHHRYPCAEFAGLAAILRRFREDCAAEQLGACPAVCVVAIAGVLQGDQLLNSNLPWPVSLAETQRDAGIARLHLINDFEALAWALPQIQAAQMAVLGHGDGRGLHLPTVLLGPGTGLGAALVVDLGGRIGVQPSEAGQATLAANTPLELDVVRLLQARFGHVSNECVLSGPGLVNLYHALCELRGVQPRWHAPAALVDAADAGHDPLASECAALFCRWLGSFAGDLAVTFRARSVCLAGGLAGHLGPYLRQGGFMQRFIDKGVLSDTLREMPVFTVEHGQLGIIGAAAWHVAHHRD